MDTLIRAATIVDGTGRPSYVGDIAITGDTVVALAPAGELAPGPGTDLVEADGLVACPGFIDIISHSITPFLTDGRSLGKVTQGVTSEIMGELWSPAPFGGRRAVPFPWGDNDDPVLQEARGWSRFSHWLEWMQARGIAVNFGSFVGGATIREYACGWDEGSATGAEIAVMCEVAAEAVRDGAFGVANALIYPPNAYSDYRELVAVARAVAQSGGIVATHMRSESDQLLEALDETIRMAEESGAPVEIYHLKASGKPNWHKMPEALRMIHAARARGLRITADMYPYTASGTGLSVLLPNWASEGGKLFDRLADRDCRARMVAEMTGGSDGISSSTDRSMDYVVPLGFRKPETKPFVGRNLDEIAAMRGAHWTDCVIDLLLAEGRDVGTVFFTMSEDNLRMQMAQPWVIFGSDSGGVDPADLEGPIHPRAFGTFTRVLAHYTRETGILALEDAVRKMTWAVAERLGIQDRGKLQAGMKADVALFDPHTVQDNGTFQDPNRLSTGVRDVWVNGRRVLRDACHTGDLPGEPLHGPGYRPR